MADVTTAPIWSLSADGNIPVPSTLDPVTVVLKKAGVTAATISLPTAGVDDGKRITIINETANAHVVTQGTDGFNNKGGAGTLTWGAAKGGKIDLVAMDGHWYTTTGAVGGVTVA